MERDLRYTTVKILIEHGSIKTFRDIFKHIPSSVVCKDMGMNYRRFLRLLAHPGRFKIDELKILGHFIKIDPVEIARLVVNEKLLKRKSI